MKSSKLARVAAVVGSGALLLSACGSDDDGDSGAIATDFGVTAEPCPDGVNQDNGCIYLGIISDLTEGPFSAQAPLIVEAQRDFWKRVNQEGGIGGYDVNVAAYTRDNKYDPQTHSQLYREIEPNILALAQTLGTPTTQAILDDMDADDVIGAPASWWSGWGFEEDDNGLILESGHSYCLSAMSALDWFAEQNGAPAKVQAVGYPGDYGGDFAAGSAAWAQANSAEYTGFVQTGPNAQVENQDGAVGQILSGGANVVALGVGPLEAGEIIGKAAQQGFTGKFIGAAPTWNPALLQSPAAPAVQALLTHVAMAESYDGDSAAHEAMRAARGEDNPPANDGYTFGWIWQYPVKAALEAAAENRDLTRAGLRAVIDGLEVDFEGALPNATFGGDPAVDADRTAVINVPDPESALGIRSVATGYTGPTAEGYDYSAACVATG